MTIKLGVPSKGRLMEKTFDWFGARGISLARTGSDREYAGKVDGIDGVELVLLSAGEIPRGRALGAPENRRAGLAKGSVFSLWRARRRVRRRGRRRVRRHQARRRTRHRRRRRRIARRS